MAARSSHRGILYSFLCRRHETPGNIYEHIQIQKLKGYKPKDSSNKSRVEFVHTNRQKDTQKKGKKLKVKNNNSNPRIARRECNKQERKTDRQTDRKAEKQTDRHKKKKH